MRADVAENNTRDILNVLFKHQRKILLTFLVIVAVATVNAFFATPVFETQSSILIKFGREYAYRPEVGEDRPPVALDRQDLINSEIEILMSRDLIDQVVQKIGIERLYPGLDEPPPLFSMDTLRAALDSLADWLAGREDRPQTLLERATTRFLRNLEIEAVARSNVIRMTFQHTDPEIAALALNTHVDQFKTKRLEVFSGTKLAFLEEQVAYYRNMLQEGEKRFEAFRQKYGVFSLDQQRSLLLNQRAALDTELKAAENRIEETAQRLTFLRDQQKKVSETVPLGAEADRFPVVDEAKSRLLALQLREQELLARYREESQFVQNVREEMRVVRDFLDRVQDDRTARTRTGKNPIYEQIELDIVRTSAENSALVARKAAIEQQIAEIENELRSLDLRDKELQEIERDIRNFRQNYDTYVARAEEARISEAMDEQRMVNISVIESAAVPTKPVAPRKTFIIALAIVFGIAAGLGLAFLVEYLSSGFVTPESAGRSLGVRVLGTVPYRTP